MAAVKLCWGRCVLVCGLSVPSGRHLVLASEILHGHFAPPLTVRSERMNFRAYNIPSEVQQEARRRQRKLKQQAS